MKEKCLSVIIYVASGECLHMGYFDFYSNLKGAGFYAELLMRSILLFAIDLL